MKRDIDKLADRLVELGREGIVIERKILEWKTAEKKEKSDPKTKAGWVPTFTLIAGANGCGKTTLTRWAREEFQESSVLDPDAIARSLQATSVNNGSIIDAGRKVLRMAEKFLATGQDFAVETTLSGQTYLRMMARAKALGYLVVLIYIGTRDVSINIQRVRYRVAKGGHDVSEEDQRRRYPRSLANARKALNMADEAIFLDNSTSAGYVKVAVKRIDGIKLFEPLPEWAAFLRD
jgi:predicted ABC-type ATPase